MTRRKRKRQLPVRPAGCLVLDSQGLGALTGRSGRARAWLRWVTSHGGSIIVPAPILVETTTGQPRTDAEVNRILRVLLAEDEPVPANQDLCRLAGRLRHKAASDDGIDALVAATAIATDLPTVILTSDPQDLEKLVGNHPKVRVSQI